MRTGPLPALKKKHATRLFPIQILVPPPRRALMSAASAAAAAASPTDTRGLDPRLYASGVRNHARVLPAGLLKPLERFLEESFDAAAAFTAPIFGGQKVSVRDNVPKFIVKRFYEDEDGRTPLSTGTAGFTYVYDWQQLAENYSNCRNICDAPAVLAALEHVNRMFGKAFNNAYVIYYTDGRKHYINQHKDKTHTFVKGTGFFLLNILLKGEPRVSLFSVGKKEIVQELPMQNNQGVFVSALANKSFKHGLPRQVGWEGLRISIVFRQINNSITFDMRQPNRIKRDGKWQDAVRIIEKQTRVDAMARAIDAAVENNDLEYLRNEANHISKDREYSLQYFTAKARIIHAKTARERNDVLESIRRLPRRWGSAAKKKRLLDCFSKMVEKKQLGDAREEDDRPSKKRRVRQRASVTPSRDRQ